MTPKEQELWQSLAWALIQDHKSREEAEAHATKLLTKARECYGDVLAKQIHMYNEAVADAAKFRDQCTKKDAALKECLKWLPYKEKPYELDSIVKEALE